MPKKQYLGFKSGARLNQVDNDPSKSIETENIALHNATILPRHANPGRMEFSERTGVKRTSPCASEHPAS